MNLSHNIGADFAASELARMFVDDPSLCSGDGPLLSNLSASASCEPSSSPWPKADGLVSIMLAGQGGMRDVAVEFKRQQEGVHGLLTAMGQAQGYIHKGYNGAAIIVPSSYSTLAEPGKYVKEVLDHARGADAVGVFRYDEPDIASPTPFAGRLYCVRRMNISSTSPRQSRAATAPKTQWVHMREGSTTRDAFFRFLQVAKRLSTGDEARAPDIPTELRAAIKRIEPGKSAEEYLSNSIGGKLLTQVWQSFWFEWIATREVLTPWTETNGEYAVPGAETRIQRDDQQGRSQIFEGRASSLKETLVNNLNQQSMTLDRAWECFAAGISNTEGQSKQGVRKRAHSYREDLDSSLAHLGWIDSDGRPTDYGYRFMTLCERFGGPNCQAAVEYFGATLLQRGHYGSFLHYIHRLSERKFNEDPLAFTESEEDRPIFNERSYKKYLSYLEDECAENLRVMRRVSGRERPARAYCFPSRTHIIAKLWFYKSEMTSIGRRYTDRLGAGARSYERHPLRTR